LLPQPAAEVDAWLGDCGDWIGGAQEEDEAKVGKGAAQRRRHRCSIDGEGLPGLHDWCGATVVKAAAVLDEVRRAAEYTSGGCGCIDLPISVSLFKATGRVRPQLEDDLSLRVFIKRLKSSGERRWGMIGGGGNSARLCRQLGSNRQASCESS
jgi:hypothetical protein